MSWRLADSAVVTYGTLSSHRTTRNVIVHIPKSKVFRFGDSNKASPVFEDLEWTVEEGESWAIVGSGWGGKKTALLQVRDLIAAVLHARLRLSRC